jgi:hypothetical protein
LPFAVTWTVSEPMLRSSHALAAEGLVWLIDPVADEEALAAATALGEVAAVLQLLDRHPRDCAELAERYEVPLLRLPDVVEGAPFTVFPVVSVPKWREHGLWWEAESLLVVPEAVGTGPYFAVGDGPVGVHPMLRMFPPAEALRAHAPERLLCGHGPSIHEGAAEAIADALDRSRRDTPRMLGKIAREIPAALRGRGGG